MPVLRHVRREYLTFVMNSVARYSARPDTLYAYQLDANYRYVFPLRLSLFGSRFTFESPLSEPTRQRVKRSASLRKNGGWGEESILTILGASTQDDRADSVRNKRTDGSS